MKRLRINRRLVRSKAALMGFTNMRLLSEDIGVGANTFYKNEPFKSSTIEKIAAYLDCDPLELIESVEDTSPKAFAPSNQPTQMRMQMAA